VKYKIQKKNEACRIFVFDTFFQCLFPIEIYEIMDPSMLQERLEELVRTFRLTSAEICAVCHGLKKIDGFIVSDRNFR